MHTVLYIVLLCSIALANAQDAHDGNYQNAAGDKEGWCAWKKGVAGSNHWWVTEWWNNFIATESPVESLTQTTTTCKAGWMGFPIAPTIDANGDPQWSGCSHRCPAEGTAQGDATYNYASCTGGNLAHCGGGGWFDPATGCGACPAGKVPSRQYIGDSYGPNSRRREHKFGDNTQFAHNSDRGIYQCTGGGSTLIEGTVQMQCRSTPSMLRATRECSSAPGKCQL